MEKIENVKSLVEGFENIKLRSCLLINIPNKVEKAIRQHVPREFLRKVDEDYETSVELCLMFLSIFVNLDYVTDGNNNPWRPLRSRYLEKNFSTRKSDSTYRKVIDLLLLGTKLKGPIIEVYKNKQGKESYAVGTRSKQYRLSNTYVGKGITTYLLKSKKATQLRSKIYYDRLVVAENNPIARSILNSYKFMSLPSREDVTKRGKDLVKNKYINSKGKRLVHKRTKVSDAEVKQDSLSYLEKHLQIFDYLTEGGLMLPIVSEESGGRVYDSLNLLPQWIRDMIKLNGKDTKEVDYSCLHPNLAVKVYGNFYSETLTHEFIADYLKEDVKKVKIENLSFFNKEWKDLSSSSLFKFYSKCFPTMMENMYKEKEEKGHKETSKTMTVVEVELMTLVLQELNNMNIYPLYIFDAVRCKVSDAGTVKEIMEKTAKKLGYNLTAK